MHPVWLWLTTYLWEPFAHFFLNGFCVNLARPLVVLVPVAIIFGQVGRGLGLPQLFRRPSVTDRLFIGAGVGVLVWQAVLAGYLFEEFATHYTFDRPPFCEQRRLEDVPADATGDAVRYRLPPGDVVSILWYAGALAVGATVSVVVIGGPYLLVRRLVVRIERKRNPEPAAADGGDGKVRADLQRLPSLAPLVFGMGFGLGLMVAISWAVLPGGSPRGDRCEPGQSAGSAPGHLVGPQRWAWEIGHCAVQFAGYGRAAGRGEKWTVYAEGHAKTLRPDGSFDPHARAAAVNTAMQKGAEAQQEGADHFEPYFAVYGLFLVGVVLAFGVFAFLAADPVYRLFRLGRPAFSPAAGLVFLLHLALLVQTVADYFFPLPQVVYVGLGVLTLLSARKYKLRFPHLLAEGQPPRDLQTHYDDVQREHAAWVRELAENPPAPSPAAEPPPPPAGRRKPLLLNRHLERWNDGTKKPMVLVCVSGGGSRAAAWAMKVLTELERRVELKKTWPLPYHIRLVSGASGGHLGAAYYVSTLEPPGADGRPPAHRYTPDTFTASGRRKPAGTLTLGELNHSVRGDFLTGIVHAMLTRDLPGLLLPRFLPPLAGYDRGQAAEWAWRNMLHGSADEYQKHRQHPRRPYTPGGLTHTFDDLWDGERAGWRPSLVFSPMMVEDGRQLLISNLDLLDILHNAGDSLDPTQPAGLISREAVEFFRLFPDATEFRVGTAARMTGSFPYVLPAVPLPTHPRRRVVDGGYYDNYGVGVAASWLFNNLEWVGRTASRVAVVQVRDGLSAADRLLTRPTDGEPTGFGLGTEWLTTPPAGLYQARVSSNMLRNDNLLHLLHQRVRERFGDTLPFVTPAFELPAGGDVSLSYTLTEPEKELIDACLPGGPARPADPALAKEVDQLEERVTRFVDWFVA